LLAALLFLLRRLEVPFIGTRGLGAVGIPFGRQYLLSVGWRTGQSGAPPDTVRCPISFQKWRRRPLQSWSRWRTGQSGAHRTVRCPHLTVGSATHHARIARPTVGPANRWLTGQSGAPPDSPVNYSRTSPDFSRERRLRRS
jgi:hypothetical protein